MPFGNWSANSGRRLAAALAAFALVSLPAAQATADDEAGSSTAVARSTAPYPPSPVIEGVEFDFDTVCTFGQGADQWPMTWSGDDHIYAGWGDGWGFGGTGSGPKHSIGITRIIGNPPDLTGEDLWGDGPGRGFGKPGALIALGDTLYMFWTRNADSRQWTATAVSHDAGVTWNYGEGQAFPYVPDTFRVRGICQFGRGYEGALDGYVYVYFGEDKAADLYLARVPKDQLFNADLYEWFVRVNSDGTAEWSSEFENRQPVFHDPNGYVWHLGVSHCAGLDRCLLTKPHFAPGDDRTTRRIADAGIASLGIFDAPAPWGPWTTVLYEDEFRDGLVKFSYFVPTKFISDDGKSFWLAWSGWPEYDSVSFVKGRFQLRERSVGARDAAEPSSPAAN